MNIVFWKVSHGTDSISDVEHKLLLDKRKVKVHSLTSPKGQSKISQGDDFVKNVSSGDFFYLCRGNSSIELIGRFNGDITFDEESWAYRSYDVILECTNKNVQYKGESKWFTPNNNSTFIRIGDFNEFNRLILEPFFDTTVDKIKVMANINDIKSLLKANHNIVLHGAPGTGKTYLAKEIAKAMEAMKENGRFDFVQFHPSYDYTDFVEGLRPVKKEGSTEIGFERRDGVFKEFCKKALADKDHDFVFVIDEINRGDMSKIFGELFFSIDPGYRGEKGKVLTQYQNLIDERDVFCDGFYVPENVYIIGTMNDIDRSVESMDFAMRRRFAFKEVKAENTQDAILKDMPNKEDLIKRMNNLNNAIEKTEGLSTDYQIGGAYFAKCKNGDYDALWNNHLSSLLKEYLRGMSDADSKFNKLKEAYENNG